MKTVFKIIFSFYIMSALISCSKNQVALIDENLTKDMSQIIVNPNFDWSASLKGELIVSFNNPNNVSTEKEIINIVNSDGEVLKRAIIKDGIARFKLNLPQNKNYYIQLPVTGDKLIIEAVGTIEMNLGETISKANSLKSTDAQSCTTCDNPILNPGGEFPAINSGFSIIHQNNVLGWETTASDKRIEIWKSGFNGVPAQEGNQFFELNANMVADLYQELCLVPGSTIFWSVWHRGRSGTDVAEVKIGGTVASAVALKTMTDGNNEWGYYSGSYTVPLGQTSTFFVFSSVSSAGSRSVGNFLDNFEIKCDADGDGIPDDEDDDPGNGEVAFISYFPTSGKQVVAFEDLWPSVGDFDFNDLTMSNKVKISKDQNFNLLSADFIVSIDAIGANIHNGIGMMLYNENGSAFNSNIISSVSGDVSLDPSNLNGLILTNDIFETIDEYYQNNGTGPTSIPDTLKFTVNFNNNASDFIPELYMFRSGNRSHEIHRSGFPITSSMNQSIFNTVNDAGNFKTANGIPWGLEIILDGYFKSPREKVDMLEAYPQFEIWATSGGTQNPNWYLAPVSSKVFDIFQ
jgi:LruC domain-containing protein